MGSEMCIRDRLYMTYCLISLQRVDQVYKAGVIQPTTTEVKLSELGRLVVDNVRKVS